jgi:hypothetical protein
MNVLFVKSVDGDACLAEAAFYESLLSFIVEGGSAVILIQLENFETFLVFPEAHFPLL